MSNPIDDLAAETIGNMRRMGCDFIVEGDKNPVWVWDAKPPARRSQIRDYWNCLDRPFGLREAMTRILLREQALEGRAL